MSFAGPKRVEMLSIFKYERKILTLLAKKQENCAISIMFLKSELYIINVRLKNWTGIVQFGKKEIRKNNNSAQQCFCYNVNDSYIAIFCNLRYIKTLIVWFNLGVQKKT